MELGEIPALRTPARGDDEIGAMTRARGCGALMC